MLRLLRRRPSRGRRTAAKKWRQAMQMGYTPPQRTRLAILAEVIYELSDLHIDPDPGVVPPELEALGKLKKEYDSFLLWGWRQIRADADLQEFGVAVMESGVPIKPEAAYLEIFRWWNFHRRRHQPLIRFDGAVIDFDTTPFSEALASARSWRSNASSGWRADPNLAPLALSTPVLKTPNGQWFQIQDPSYPEDEYKVHPDVAIARFIGDRNGHCYGNSPDWFRRVSAWNRPGWGNNRYLYQLYATEEAASPGRFIGALTICPKGCTENLSGDTREGSYVPISYYGATLRGNGYLYSPENRKYWADYWGLMEHVVGKMPVNDQGKIYIPSEAAGDFPFFESQELTDWHANHPHYTIQRKRVIGEWVAEIFAPGSEVWSAPDVYEFVWSSWRRKSARSGLPGDLGAAPELFSTSSGTRALMEVIKDHSLRVHDGHIYIPVEAILPSWWDSKKGALLEEAKKAAALELRQLPRANPARWPRRRGSPKLYEPRQLPWLPIPQGMSGRHIVVKTFPDGGRTDGSHHYLVLDPDTPLPAFKPIAEELLEDYFNRAVVVWKESFANAEVAAARKAAKAAKAEARARREAAGGQQRRRR